MELTKPNFGFTDKLSQFTVAGMHTTFLTSVILPSKANKIDNLLLPVTSVIVSRYSDANSTLISLKINSLPIPG